MGRIMAEDINGADSYQAASERLDRALSRLHQAVKSVDDNFQSATALEQQRAVLANDCDRLNKEVTQLKRRSDGLDQSAAEVARRLVDAMESVRTVLAK